MKLESITNEIIELNNKIKELEKLREEELKKEKYWYLGKDGLELHCEDSWSSYVLSIHSNYESFKYSKENIKRDILFLGIEGDSTDCSVSLNINQVKQISDYLLKVINYMEAE